jgi:type I restriction enzyme M protein
MPSNIFATTGTNVSILFIDKGAHDKVVLIDASNLGTKVKEGKNQKTLLSGEEEQRIIAAFNGREAVEDFSVVVGYDEIAARNCSLSAGQYFDVKIEYSDMTPEQFAENVASYNTRLAAMFNDSRRLEAEIAEAIGGFNFDRA